MQLRDGINRLGGVDGGIGKKQAGRVEVGIKAGGRDKALDKVFGAQGFGAAAAAFGKKVPDAPAAADKLNQIVDPRVRAHLFHGKPGLHRIDKAALYGLGQPVEHKAQLKHADAEAVCNLRGMERGSGHFARALHFMIVVKNRRDAVLAVPCLARGAFIDAAAADSRASCAGLMPHLFNILKHQLAPEPA